MLLVIYCDNDFEKFRKADNTKTRILLLSTISLKLLVFLFLLLNIVILYTKL